MLGKYHVMHEMKLQRKDENTFPVEIGDFGCGEAKIMESFGSDRVRSFDHYAINESHRL